MLKKMLMIGMVVFMVFILGACGKGDLLAKGNMDQNKRMNENTETFNVKLCKIYYLISSSFSLLFDK